jgi:hypothetical protein
MKFASQMVLLAIGIITISVSANTDKKDNCISCHQDAVLSYQRSQMAQAASTKGFLKEWQQNGQADYCLDCHSPSRTQGVICQDCHAQDAHTVKPVLNETLCAQCHHAAGENTFRTYLNSPAAKQGAKCVSCHINIKKSGHEFIGPSSAGFMQGVARLKLSIRKQEDELIAIVQIRHSAGHALPGGTTGRSVWIVFESYDKDCTIVSSNHARFGWTKTFNKHMVDNTLAAGKTTVVEFPVSQMEKVVAIRARMLYRFVPGALNNEDNRQILLDERRYELRQGYPSCKGLYTN